jgi:hypothetical protein
VIPIHFLYLLLISMIATEEDIMAIEYETWYRVGNHDVYMIIQAPQLRWVLLDVTVGE